MTVERVLKGTPPDRIVALERAMVTGMKDAAYQAFLQRSGLGPAFERPVSAFSQGMQARLGFAAADQGDPEVLLLDEVHEALDHEYREVVEHRAKRILADGGVVVATGHDHHLLARFCERALLLSGGMVVADGRFDETQSAYLD